MQRDCSTAGRAAQNFTRMARAHATARGRCCYLGETPGGGDEATRCCGLYPKKDAVPKIPQKPDSAQNLECGGRAAWAAPAHTVSLRAISGHGRSRQRRHRFGWALRVRHPNFAPLLCFGLDISRGVAGKPRVSSLSPGSCKKRQENTREAGGRHPYFSRIRKTSPYCSIGKISHKWPGLSHEKYGWCPLPARRLLCARGMAREESSPHRHSRESGNPGWWHARLYAFSGFPPSRE